MIGERYWPTVAWTLDQVARDMHERVEALQRDGLIPRSAPVRIVAEEGDRAARLRVTVKLLPECADFDDSATAHLMGLLFKLGSTYNRVCPARPTSATRFIQHIVVDADEPEDDPRGVLVGTMLCTSADIDCPSGSADLDDRILDR